MGHSRQLRKGKDFVSSLNDDQLQVLAEMIGVDDPSLLSNDIYADNVWRWVKDHGKEAAAMEYLNVKVGFNDQFKEIEEREEIWKEFSDKTEELLNNTPEYKIPEAISNLSKNIGTYAANIKNEYVSAGNKLEAITGEKLDSIISGVLKGTEEQKKIAEEGAGKIEDIYGTGAKKVEDIYGKGAGKIEDIYGEGAKKIEDYLGEGVSKMGDYSSKIIETLTEGGEEALAAKLKGIGEYEDVYGRLATRSTLPGEDIMKAQLEAQQETAVQRVKEYGSGSAGALSAVAGVYEGGQEQLRNLEVQRANWLTENQKNYADAMLTGGLQRGKAFGEKALTTAGAYETAAGITERGTKLGISGQQTATEMAGYGAKTATEMAGYGIEKGIDYAGYGAETGLNKRLEASRYATEVGYEAGMTGLQTELDVSKQASLLRTMGYEKEADMMISNAMTTATYEDQQFQINEMMPWQSKLGYYTAGTQQYDPFAATMEYYGDVTATAQAERQGILDEQASKRKMWGNIIGSILDIGGNVLGFKLGSSKGGE